MKTLVALIVGFVLCGCATAGYKVTKAPDGTVTTEITRKAVMQHLVVATFKLYDPVTGKIMGSMGGVDSDQSAQVAEMMKQMGITFTSIGTAMAARLAQ